MLKSIARLAMKSNAALNKLASKGFIGQMIEGPIRQVARPILSLRWLFRANRKGRVNIFKNIARRMKLRVKVFSKQAKNFVRHPLKSTKGWIRNAVGGLAMGMAATYALKTLFGGSGNSKPSGSNAPQFNANPPNLTSGSNGAPPGGMNATKTAGLIDKVTKNNAKAETANKIAEAKAELTAATKAANSAKPFVSKVPSKLKEIHARGKSSDEKLDTVIELLNQGNQIQNENRRSNEEQLKRQEQDIKNRLYKSSELYRNLTKLQAQQNSANADAIKVGLAENGDKVSKAVASQTSAYQSQVKEAKKSSLLKWILFGGIALGVSSIAKNLGGVGELLSSGFDLMSKGFHSIGNMLGLLHDDNTDMANGETSETATGKDKSEGEDYSKDDKAKDDSSIKSTLDQNEKLSDKLGTSSGKASAVATASYAGKKVGGKALKATKAINSLAKNSSTLKAEKALNKSKVTEQKAAVKQAKEALSAAKKSGDKKSIREARKALKSAKSDLKAAKKLSKSATIKSAAGSTANKVKSLVTSAGSAMKDTAVDMAKDAGIDKGIEKVKGGFKKVGSKVGAKVVRSRLGKYVTDRLVRILGAKIAAKAGGRLIPGIGIGIGVLAAGKRIMRGDWLGAFGEIASTTAAQLGELGIVASGGMATAAGIAASFAIDSLVLMHDQRLATEYAEKGDIKNLLSMGFEPADIAEMIYNAVDESGNPAPLNKNHPLRKNFESKYKTVVSIASGKDIVPAIILAQGILDHDAPLYKDYEKNYNSVQKLLDRHLSWTDIAEIVESADPNGPLFRDFMKYYDVAVPAIMRTDSRTNDNALVLGKIAQKSTGDFRKKFETQYGNPKEFLNKHDKIKKSPLSKVLRGFKWGSDKLKKGLSWASKALSAPFEWAWDGLKGIAEDTADRLGITKLFGGKTRVEKEKRKNAIDTVARENGLVVSEKGEPGTVSPQQFESEYKTQIAEQLKKEKNPQDYYSKLGNAGRNIGKVIGKGYIAGHKIKNAIGSGIQSAWGGLKSFGGSALEGIKNVGGSIVDGAESAWNWFAGYAEGTKDPGVPYSGSFRVGEAPDKSSKYRNGSTAQGKSEELHYSDGTIGITPGNKKDGVITHLDKGEKVKPTVRPKLKWATKIANKLGRIVKLQPKDNGLDPDVMSYASGTVNTLGNGKAPATAVDYVLAMRPVLYNVLKSKKFIPANDLEDYTNLLTGQSALESTWGKSGLSVKYNNFSGMTKGTAKYHGTGSVAMNNKAGTDPNVYATFQNVYDWADDYVEYLNRKWNAFSRGPKNYGAQLQNNPDHPGQSYAGRGQGYERKLYDTSNACAKRWAANKGGTPRLIEGNISEGDGTSNDSNSVGGKSIEEIIDGMVTKASDVSKMGSKMKFAEGTAVHTIPTIKTSKIKSKRRGFAEGTATPATPAIQKAKAAGWDIPSSIESLNSHANSRSTGYCARYVRQALESGGINTYGRPGSATEYDSYLPKIGFEYQDPSNYKPQTGDISIIKATPRHKYGHISMFNGKNWISDFVQNRKDGDVYSGTGGPILYFRYKALGNSNPGDLSSIAPYGGESDWMTSIKSKFTSFRPIEDILGGMFGGISWDLFKNVNPWKIQASASGSPDTGVHTTESVEAEGKGDAPITAAIAKPVKSNITQLKSNETKEKVKNTSTEPQKTIVDNSGGNTIANSFNTVNNNYHSECKIEQERNPLTNLMNS